MSLSENAMANRYSGSSCPDCLRYLNYKEKCSWDNHLEARNLPTSTAPFFYHRTIRKFPRTDLKCGDQLLVPSFLIGSSIQTYDMVVSYPYYVANKVIQMAWDKMGAGCIP